MGVRWQAVAMVVWVAGQFGTFIYLLFFDGYRYTAWNWLIAVPVDFFMGMIWPLYWLVLKPIFGA